MGAKVVITRAQLDAKKPCDARYYEQSPSWDPVSHSLVYQDIDVEVKRLADKADGSFLRWLAFNGLIPITRDQAQAAIAKARRIRAKGRITHVKPRVVKR